MNEKIALLTIDTESWLISSKDLFKSTKNLKDIPIPESLLKNTYWFLRLFNDLSIKATFFILGCVAEKYPSLLKDILKHNHELGNHGYFHNFLYEYTEEEINENIFLGHEIIQRITGVTPKSFRAPYFSISEHNLPIIFSFLKNLGYTVDSSIFPIKTPLYGINNFDSTPKIIDGILVIPISIFSFYFFNFSLSLPISGGGYYRITPELLMMQLVKKYIKHNNTILLYFHPYEIDPNDIEIRNDNLSLKEKLIYIQQRVGRGRMKQKIKNILNLLKNWGFLFMSLQEFYEYKNH